MRDHVSTELLHRYARGDTAIAADAVWAVESHVEWCPACRGRLGDAVDAGAAALLDRVRTNLAAAVAASPPVAPRRRWMPRRTARWVTPALVPWLLTTVLVIVVAVGFDLAATAGRGPIPSLVLLIAPVVPLVGVAAAWTRGLDPAHELVTATPRAGLPLVLRRTLAILAVVIPALAVAGLLVGASPARWLVPCLAFTAGALALGELVGLPGAAGGLALLWVTGVVAPSIVTARTPVVLTGAALPAWAALTAVLVVALAVHPRAFTRIR